MKKSKLTSIIASVTVVASMVSGITASANIQSITEEEIKNSEIINYDDVFSCAEDGSLNNFRNFDKAYWRKWENEYGNTMWDITYTYRKDPTFYVMSNDFKSIKKALESVDLDLRYELSLSESRIGISIDLKNGKTRGLNSFEAKKICNILKDDYGTIDYRQDIWVDSWSYQEKMALYDIKHEDTIKNYIEEHNIAATIETVNYWSYMFPDDDDEINDMIPVYLALIVFDEELTDIEHYRLAKAIYDETDILPHGAGGFEGMDNSISTSINVIDYTNGDANEDSYLTLADSVAILQSIGNPDRYGLSAQGEFNADVDGNAGITGADALVIQQMELGIL